MLHTLNLHTILSPHTTHSLRIILSRVTILNQVTILSPHTTLNRATSHTLNQLIIPTLKPHTIPNQHITPRHLTILNRHITLSHRITHSLHTILKPHTIPNPHTTPSPLTEELVLCQ